MKHEEWWKKLKEGDYVVTLPKPGIRKGFGYEPNCILKITRNDDYDTHNVYFFEKWLSGICNDSIRLANPSEIKQYKKLNKPTYIIHSKKKVNLGFKF